MTIFESRIENFISVANCGDEMVLSCYGSVEKGTGLILGYGSDGWYLQDDGLRADLGLTVTLDDVLANATDWARDTGAELACH
jgi:hypothetical protein